MHRRGFIQTVIGLATGLGASRHRAFSGEMPSRNAVKLPTDQIQIAGKLKASRLALGTGTSGWGGSSNQTRQLGDAGVARLFQAAFDRGINFWDAADQYGSHPCLKEALKSIERDKVVILTKTRASTAEGVKKDIERFCREIGTDHIDVLLLHCMTDPRWPDKMRGAMDAIEEAQQLGKVVVRGVSCHSLGALQAAEKSEWVQFDLARINPAGDSMDASPDVIIPILKSMKTANKTVMGMKVFGAGSLRHRIDECLRFQLSLDCVDCFTLGFENLSEFESTFASLQRIGKEVA